jgi:hypothetical protein
MYFMFGGISVYDEIPGRNCQAFEIYRTPAEGRGASVLVFQPHTC